MYAVDFEYDGINLSERGFVICEFDSGGSNTFSNGSEITFNTVPILNGKKHELSSVKYETRLEATFQICKDSCVYEDLRISSDELRYLMRWLNRRQFHKFKLLDDDHYDMYFEGSFNINRIEYDGILYGLELNLITNRPYALHEPKVIKLESAAANSKFTINDNSDDEGFIYPSMKITVKQSGNLKIVNAFENRTTLINNCTSGEIITMDYPVITTSVPGHKIQDDFNWSFFRVANTFNNYKNEITVSLPCTIELTYSPAVKIGI